MYLVILYNALIVANVIAQQMKIFEIYFLLLGHKIMKKKNERIIYAFNESLL